MKPSFATRLVLFLLLILTACVGQNVRILAKTLPSPTVSTFITTQTTPYSEATRSATNTITAKPTATPSPTFPSNGVIVKPAITATPTPQPTVEYRKDCITIEDNVLLDLHPGGALLLYGGSWESYWDHSMYHLDFMSQRKSPLPSSAEQYSLSPDGKWLAYLDLTRDEKGRRKALTLKVTNSEGRHLDMSYWGLNWQNLLGWQDEKHLIIEATGYPSGNFLILNPFTMQKEVMKIDVPPRLPWMGQVYPDPSLSYWVIPPDDNRQGYHWRLLRRDGWQTLWDEDSSSFNYPDWSPDGRSFAVMGGINHAGYWVLLNVGLEGKPIPLTNQIGEGKELSWSPDSRFLAGWLNMNSNVQGYDDPNHLVMIDVEKPLLTDLCFENQMKKYSTDWNTPPVWSPDGRYVAIAVSRIIEVHEVYGITHQKIVWDTALIDVQEHRAYMLAKDARPMVWMNKPK